MPTEKSGSSKELLPGLTKFTHTCTHRVKESSGQLSVSWIILEHILLKELLYHLRAEASGPHRPSWHIFQWNDGDPWRPWHENWLSPLRKLGTANISILVPFMVFPRMTPLCTLGLLNRCNISVCTTYISSDNGQSPKCFYWHWRPHLRYNIS